jgi:hypothetical protein
LSNANISQISKNEKDDFLKNKIRDRSNTAKEFSYHKKQKITMNKNQSSKNLSRMRYIRPQTSKANHKIRKELTEEKKQTDYSALVVTPKGIEVSINITDSDSKQFFDEVFNDPQDLDNMLLDMPLIEEEKLQYDGQHEEDNEFDIKREIQTMKEGKIRRLLLKEPRHYNPSDDEEGS